MNASSTAAENAVPNIAADRVLQVLSAFLHSDDELGVADISRRVGLDKSVVHRILTTLTRHKYVQQSEQTRKYRVGIAAWELGNRFVSHGWANDLAVPLLADLLQRHGSTGYVGSLDGGDVVYLATVNGSGPFQVSADVGSRTSALTTALGRAILSKLEPVHVQLAIEMTQPTPDAVAMERLDTELDKARARGYAVSKGEAVVGVGAVGAAVCDARGEPLGAVSVAFPMIAEYDHLWDILPPAIVRIASDVSGRLG